MNGAFKQAFPELENEGFRETSSPSGKYNCIAWAAGDHHQWWWPYEHPAYYWPPGVTRVVTLESFFQAFAAIGYQHCETGDLEAGFEKVALYSVNAKPKHAARQLLDGQ